MLYVMLAGHFPFRTPEEAGQAAPVLLQRMFPRQALPGLGNCLATVSHSQAASLDCLHGFWSFALHVLLSAGDCCSSCSARSPGKHWHDCGLSGNTL